VTPVKQLYAGETQVHAFDFTSAVPPGATTISSATLQAFKMESGDVYGVVGDDVTTDFLESSAGVINGYRVYYQFKDIVGAGLYKVLCTATFNDGQTVAAPCVYYQV